MIHVHTSSLAILAICAIASLACIGWGLHGSDRHLTPTGRAVLVGTGFISLLGAVFLARLLWLMGALP